MYSYRETQDLEVTEDAMETPGLSEHQDQS